MKNNIKNIIAVICCVGLLSSCIKEVDKTFKGETVVEIDATVLNSSNSVAGYPVISRIPVAGRPATTADSTLRRLNGRNIEIRLNLVGPQSTSDRTIGYKIISTSPLTTFAFPATASGQTPTAAAATLNVLSAVIGTHVGTLSGVCTIPAGSSFGIINVEVLRGTATAGQARFIGIQLDSTGTLRPNPNYNKLGLVIDQR